MFFGTATPSPPCPRKVFLPCLFKAYYTAQEIDGHRSWNIDSCTTTTTTRIEAPDISISNRTILYAPRNAISPYAARAIYFVFPGEHIFCAREYVSIWRGYLDGRGIIGTVPRLSFFFFLQIEYFRYRNRECKRISSLNCLKSRANIIYWI